MCIAGRQRTCPSLRYFVGVPQEHWIHRLGVFQCSVWLRKHHVYSCPVSNIVNACTLLCLNTLIVGTVVLCETALQVHPCYVVTFPQKKTTWFWVCLASLEIYTRAVWFIRQSMKLSLFLCVSTAVSSQFKANMRLMLDLRAPLRVRSKAIVYSCISGRSTAGRNKVVSGIDSNKARPSFECGWSLRVHIPVYICFVWMYSSVCLKTLLKLNTLSSKISKSLHVFICGQVTRTVIYRFPGRNLCHRNKVSHTYATQPLVLLFCFHVSIFFFLNQTRLQTRSRTTKCTRC